MCFLLGTVAAPEHAELALLLFSPASPVPALRDHLQGNSRQGKAVDSQLWSPAFFLSACKRMGKFCTGCLPLLAELIVSCEDYLGQLESGLGSVSWLPTTEVIPKSREVVRREWGGSSVVLRGFPFQDGAKTRGI